MMRKLIVPLSYWFEGSLTDYLDLFFCFECAQLSVPYFIPLVAAGFQLVFVQLLKYNTVVIKPASPLN